MKLASKDVGRLLDLRRRAEDPARWNWEPGKVFDAIGRDRFQKIVEDAKEGPISGTRLLQFTREEAARVVGATNAPQEQRLSYGVLVLFEVSGVQGEGREVAVLRRHASLSRANGERLPERYVRQVVAKLGFGEGADVSVNPGSGVWHVHEDFEPADS